MTQTVCIKKQHSKLNFGNAVMTLNDFIVFAQAHRRSSVRFLTTYMGEDIYYGFSAELKGKKMGYPLLMKEEGNEIVALNHKQIIEVLSSLPDEE